VADFRILNSLEKEGELPVQSTRQSELEESNLQFSAAWQAFARKAKSGEVRQTPGLTLACSGVTFPILNGAFLSQPVTDAADFGERLAAAVAYFNSRGLHWMFPICKEWISEAARTGVQEELARHRLQPAMELAGMVTEQLAPPLRSLPQLEFRRAGDEETRIAVSEINAVAYQVPSEWALEAMNTENFWQEEIAGYVGYKDGKPVTCAGVLMLAGVRYVALVATLAEYRRLGYAEAVMRFGLDQARQAHGIDRTVLHATPAGLPLYRQMGYRTVATFTFYLSQ
jgi:GNAT superfamily N-acetyltransferase